MPLQLDATKHVRVPMTDAELDAQVVSPRGFTHGQLHAAFKVVQNPTNWKLPIRYVLDGATQAQGELIEDAIAYIAGGGAEFFVIGAGRVLVRAPGYYNLIGA